MLNFALYLSASWRRLFHLFILFFFSLYSLFGQSNLPRFETLSNEQGLSQVSVFSILQDRRGYLWVGTQDGLNRYDGYRFVVFNHHSEDPRSLSGNYIRTLLEDQYGVLWIGTDAGGLSRFNEADETFTAYRHDPEVSDSLSNNRVYTSFEDRKGEIWLGTWSGGLNKMIRHSEGDISFEHFRNEADRPDSLSHNAVTAIDEDDQGHLWLGTFGGGLNRFDGADFKAWRQGSDNGPADDRILAVKVDRKGIIWIGSYGGGLNRFDPIEERFTVYRHDPDDPQSIGSNRVSSLYEDVQGSLWIGTSNGLNKLDDADWSRYRHDPANPYGLGHNRIESIYADRSGLLWIGTMGNGLGKLDPKVTRFGHHPRQAGNPDDLNDGSILSFCEARDGALWVGTYSGGLNLRQPGSDTFVHFRHDPSAPDSLSHNTVFAIRENRKGDLWIGTDGGGLNRKRADSDKFEHFRHDANDPASLSNDRVSALLIDNDDRLWIGTLGGGLNLMESGGTGRFTHFKNDPNRQGSLSHDTIFSLFQDQSGVLWVGAWGGGLNRFDAVSETFISFKHDPNNPRSLSHNTVNAIFQDTHGALWLGTSGGGLNRLDVSASPAVSNQARFDRYGKREGLSSNVIYGILGDGRGLLWLSTNKGLVRFDPERDEFRTYSQRDGLQSDEFNFGAYHRGASGRMYFGGNRGFNQFFPNQLEDHLQAPTTVLTDFLLLNKPVPTGRGSGSKSDVFQLDQPIGQTSQIHLSHRNAMLSFEFAALHYADSGRNQYRYKLDGFDRDWITTNADRRVATYTNLNPGSYTFKVVGSNKDGVWSDQPATVALVIDPPFWLSSWAYVGYVILMMLILFAVYRAHLTKLYRERERSRQLDQMVAARTRELQQNNQVLTAQQKELLDTQEQLLTQAEALAEQTTRLKEMDQAKTSFFTNISHELRTPLTLITAPLANMLEQGDGFDRNELHMVHRNAARLKRLIDQLLDVVSLEAGNPVLNLEAANLVDFAASCVDLFSSWACRRGIALEFEAEREEMIVCFDPDKLETVLTNLLINAFKFSHDGGEIRVSIYERDEYVFLEVADTGIGLSQDQMARVFDRFYQAPESSNQGGSGIGLFLARELLTLHGGVIDVVSQPGQGCTFRFQLPHDAHPRPDIGKPVLRQRDPLTALQPAASKEIEDMTPSAKNSASATVLVIEDNQDMLTFLCRQLGNDYQLLEATDGVNGFSLALKHLPDLVLSDVMMPGLTGLELVRRLKQDTRTSHIPILLLTARCSPQDKHAGLEIGADDFLIKPFDRVELMVRIANLIEQRRRLRERYRSELLLNPEPVKNLSADEVFLKKVSDIVEGFLSDSEFTALALAEEVGFSTRQLARKLKALTNRTPAEFIRHFRLQRSALLLEQKAGGVAEIAYRVGFKSPRHFATLFRETFGASPTDYAAQPLKNRHEGT